MGPSLAPLEALGGLLASLGSLLGAFRGLVEPPTVIEVSDAFVVVNVKLISTDLRTCP